MEKSFRTKLALGLAIGLCLTMAGCLDNQGPQLSGQDANLNMGYTVWIGEVNAAHGNIPLEGRLFKVENGQQARQIKIVFHNEADLSLQIEGGGLRCKNADNNSDPPFEPRSYYFECMHCTNRSSCTTSGEEKVPGPSGDCVLERGQALYQISPKESASLVTRIQSNGQPTATTDCIMTLWTNRGRLDIPFQIEYRVGS